MLAPFAALFALMIACAAIGLHALAHEVDRSDAVRTREAVAAAFRFQHKRLEDVTLNNAVYTEAARAVGGATVDRKWAIENWAVSPVGLPGYHGVFLLEADGRPIVGTRAGLPLAEPTLRALARLAAPVSKSLPVHGAASVRGIVRGASGPMLVAAANVVPEPGDRTPASMAGPKRRLVIVHPVAQPLLATMNETIGGEDLRLGGAPGDANAVRFAVADSAPLVLSWRSRNPGGAAMTRALQQIAPVFVAATLLLAFATQASLAATRALERLANQDQLTGLPNRAAFRAELDARLAQGTGVTLGLIDLDGFKLVNDRHGHLAGDDLLVSFARTLARVKMPGDEVGRLGGDEFAFVTPSAERAERLAARLRAELEAPLAVGSLSLAVGASIGIASAAPGMAARDLIALADARLYRDKGGRRAARPGEALPERVSVRTAG